MSRTVKRVPLDFSEAQRLAGLWNGVADDVTATLERMRHRNRDAGPESDIMTALDALGAVLALPAHWEAKGSRSSALEEDRARVRDDCARELREAAAAALTGKGEADG